MIQIISLNEIKEYNHKQIVLSTFKTIRSLDTFDVNIIDLRCINIWKNNYDSCKSVNCENDLFELCKMLEESKKANNLIIYPRNCIFSYFKNSYSPDMYYGNKKLRYIIKNFSSIISNTLLGFLGEDIKILYEINNTIIYDSKIKSDFYFKIGEPITYSYKSEKFTTIKLKGLTLTTLDIPLNTEFLFKYLSFIKLREFKESSPEWFNNIRKFDDEELINEINLNKKKIEFLELENKNNSTRLEANNRIKSILYTNEDELVEIIYDILQETLECDLSDFVDEYKEDFIIEKEDITFIGEIKGVKSNVKRRHISQIDEHVQDYNDRLDEENKIVKTKGLLIINYQRDKEPQKREVIKEEQINIAKRNDCLIISTIELLDLYEDYKKGNITSDKVIELFTNEIGLFKYR